MCGGLLCSFESPARQVRSIVGIRPCVACSCELRARTPAVRFTSIVTYTMEIADELKQKREISRTTGRWTLVHRILVRNKYVVVSGFGSLATAIGKY